MELQTVNSSSLSSSLRATSKLEKHRRKSVLQAWIYLLKKMTNSKTELHLFFIDRKTVKFLEKLLKTVSFTFYDEKCNYYKSITPVQPKKDIPISKAVVFDDVLTVDNFGSIPLDSLQSFICIFKVLNNLPENISLKDCTILNQHNNKVIPALQVLMNIAIVNLSEMDIPTCELLTNICIQFMQRGYNLSDFTPDEKYHPLPLFFIALQMAIRNNFRGLLDIFLEKNIDWNVSFYHADGGLDKDDPRFYSEEEKYYLESYNNNYESVHYEDVSDYYYEHSDPVEMPYREQHLKASNFVMGRCNPKLCGICTHEEGLEMCEGFKNYLQILGQLLDKGMPIPWDWDILLERHDCFFYNEGGFGFLKKLHWAGADVTRALRESLNSRFADMDCPYYRGLVKYTEWFERQQKLSLRLTHLAKLAVQKSMNAEAMEKEIKSGRLPQGLRSIMLNYQPRRDEE